jgi:hypothetical protein
MMRGGTYLNNIHGRKKLRKQRSQGVAALTEQARCGSEGQILSS